MRMWIKLFSVGPKKPVKVQEKDYRSFFIGWDGFSPCSTTEGDSRRRDYPRPASTRVSSPSLLCSYSGIPQKSPGQDETGCFLSQGANQTGKSWSAKAFLSPKLSVLPSNQGEIEMLASNWRQNSFERDASLLSLRLWWVFLTGKRAEQGAQESSMLGCSLNLINPLCKGPRSRRARLSLRMRRLGQKRDWPVGLPSGRTVPWTLGRGLPKVQCRTFCCASLCLSLPCASRHLHGVPVAATNVGE